MFAYFFRYEPVLASILFDEGALYLIAFLIVLAIVGNPIRYSRIRSS